MNKVLASRFGALRVKVFSAHSSQSLDPAMAQGEVA